ncbi:MAG TPA: hypothetical protein VGM98_20030 [Schlesneria sp.]|jgi:hypothetical protein
MHSIVDIVYVNFNFVYFWVIRVPPIFPNAVPFWGDATRGAMPTRLNEIASASAEASRDEVAERNHLSQSEKSATVDLVDIRCGVESWTLSYDESGQ